MKINFKKPKYFVPLIILPFIFIFYAIITNWTNHDANVKVAVKDTIPTDQINPNMPGVSAEVTDAELKNKFGAYMDVYKYNKDASALDNINNNGVLQGNDFSSAYSAEDLQKLRSQQKLDSLQRMLQSGQQDIDRQMQQIYSNTRRTPSYQKRGTGNNISQEELLRGFTFNADEHANAPQAKPDSYADQMKLFREQVSVMDSMQQAYTAKATGSGNTSAGEDVSSIATKNKKTLTNNFDKNRFDPSRDSSFTPLPVKRNRGTKTGFNTLQVSKPEQHITAIIDQDIKAMAGSRVRIRLLNDIFVGDYLIPKGTYIYGVVTGFQTQRINVSVNQIFYENTPLPVQLDVFDNDGYLGLYVPGSTFREFTKEIGTQGTQGLSQVRTSDNSNVTTGLINQVFQSTSTSVSKLIQKEKAFLKYNYIVYLRERN